MRATTDRLTATALATAALLAVGFVFSGSVAAGSQTPAAAAAAPTAATPDDAKPFLGAWTATVDAPPGPVAFAITVKVEAGKVLGSVGNEMMGDSPVTDIKKSGNALILRYTIDMQGNVAPVALTLVPEGDKMKTTFSFMDGQFEMGGLATKKP